MTLQTGWGASLLLGQAIAFSIGSTAIAALAYGVEVRAEVGAETQGSVRALPDLPEEVLRSEIYTDARSPIDGKLLTAAEYMELMENLRSLDRIPPEDLVSPQIQEVINLLKLRKFLRQIVPFIP